ncbi:sigma-70 family RNA polymerase sigma factor [Catenovulum agarivorans]|uniref:sigma-70 family RNA polymerase sigma factor n=1 Tax=Catenovulum agarivorans TaxID=1172192 RepID=UPI0002EECDBE|nr:sigma-70 family RNA polymerase sigma factor [Catenovulum agarivorans]
MNKPALRSTQIAENNNGTELVDTSAQFLALFEAERKRIYAYIYAFVGDKAAADDIFQETSTILWREFDKFTLGTSFTKWSNAIVFNCVRTFRRNNKSLVGLSDEVLNELVANADYSQSSEQRWNALQSCRAQLPESDQRLYQDFYVENQNAQEIAGNTGRSIFGVRKSIHRLRKKLFDCVDRKKREGIF